MLRVQPLVTVLMMYGTYITAKCPCKRTLSCHLREFFLSVGTASALVLYENRLLSPMS